MQPEVPPLPPMPPPALPPGYPVNTPPPPVYPLYAAPPPRGGVPAWVWVLAGCVGCFFVVPILAAIVLPVFASARAKARQVSCMSNVKIIGLGNLMYVEDYDQQFPIASNWQSGIVPYVKDAKVFHCPAVQEVPDPSDPPATNYAFNSAIDMLKLKRLAEPQNTVLIFESTSFNLNANDALTSLPVPGRHPKGNDIGFTDGHATYWHDSESLPTGKILPDTP